MSNHKERGNQTPARRELVIPVFLRSADGQQAPAHILNLRRDEKGVQLEVRAPVLIGVEPGHLVAIREVELAAAEVPNSVAHAPQEARYTIPPAPGNRGHSKGSKFATVQPIPNFLVPLLQKHGLVKRDKDNRPIPLKKKRKWVHKEELCKQLIRLVVENMAEGKDPRNLTQVELRKATLTTMVQAVFRTIYDAVNAAYSGLHIMPWQMKTAPKSLFKVKKNRINAVLWLEHETGKKPGKINREDFEKHDLHHLADIKEGYGYAILEAHPEMSVWDLFSIPPMYFKELKSPQARKALQEAAETLSKRGYGPKDLSHSRLRKEHFEILTDVARRVSMEVQDLFREAGVKWPKHA